MLKPNEVLMANNAGLVTLTGTPTIDLIHTLSTGRSARIVSVHWYNNTGVQLTFIIGTSDNSAIPLFVPLFPTITCVNGQHGILTEDELIQLDFQVDNQLTVNGRTGNIDIVGSAAGIIVRMTIAEKL